MLENRRLDPRLGRWASTERLRSSGLTTPQAETRALNWAELLLKRHGIVTRELLRRDVSAPPWRDVQRALAKMDLLGKVRRGFLVEDISGEQCAYPDAVDALREAKLRCAEEREYRVDPVTHLREPMVLLNACDPANPFTSLFPTVDEVGAEARFSRNRHQYMIVHAGRPILLYQHQRAITLLVDLSRGSAERALETLMQIVESPSELKTYDEIVVRDWNRHPIDVSPARHLLTLLGFVKSRPQSKGLVYDGLHSPDPSVLAHAQASVPSQFERAGKEKAPVSYDAEWIISRSDESIGKQVRHLIRFLNRELPPECELVYSPRRLNVLCRGVKCMTPWIQGKQIRLHITHKGWTSGILVKPDTELATPQFLAEVVRQLEQTRRDIDALLGTAAA